MNPAITPEIKKAFEAYEVAKEAKDAVAVDKTFGDIWDLTFNAGLDLTEVLRDLRAEKKNAVQA